MSEIQQTVAWMAAYIEASRGRARRDERGAGVAETVIIVAIIAAGAIAIATLIVTKFTQKANQIPTGG